MFNDAINEMRKRTWPYGTCKTVLLSEVTMVRSFGMFVLAMEVDEAHILIGGGHDIEPEKGRKAVMRFEKGGPTGGYWKLIKFVEE